MKILILNDSHDKGKNSAMRLGNMHEDLLLQLDETLNIAKNKKCKFIIHLGDIWDSPYVSNSVIDDWLDRIEESDIPFAILPGNHDMIGASWETSERSSLAHAYKRCKKYLRFMDELDRDNFYIKGYPYYYECEEDIKKNGLKHNQKDKFTIACTHSFITIKPFHPKVLHVRAKDIKTNYDLILCSHFHSYFDETINNTRYLNLGAWGRLSITEAKQEPKVAILDTITREIEIIKLKSAKPAEEIFDLSKVEELKANKKGIEDFIKSIEDVSFQEMSIKDTIKYIAKEKNLDKEPVDLILQKLGELK